MMTMLPELLKQEGISSRESLARYVQEHYGQSHTIPFRILKKKDIPLDDENRMYGDDIKYENVIFDTPYIRISNSKRVFFKDCVFTGALTISDNTPGLESVLLDYCLIRNALKISNLQQCNSVTIQCVNAPNVLITSSNLGKLNIASSHIGHFTIIESKICTFDTFNNFFQYLDVGKCDFSSVKFPVSQIDISKQPSLPSEKLAKTIADNFSEFDFETKLDFGKLSSAEGKALRDHTFSFLLEHSDAAISRDVFAHLKYLKAVASQPNFPLRWAMMGLGAFIKPSRILLLIVIMFGLFSMFYWLFALKFHTPDDSPADTERSVTSSGIPYFTDKMAAIPGSNECPYGCLSFKLHPFDPPASFLERSLKSDVLFSGTTFASTEYGNSFDCSSLPFTFHTPVISQTNSGRSLEWDEVLYFSGVTFATIGYGDYTPLERVTRFLAVLEGLVGILLTSIFVVSLTRKYGD